VLASGDGMPSGARTTNVDAKATLILGAAPLLALDGTLDALAVGDLVRLWPPPLASSVRTWLAARVGDGTLRSCRVQLGLHPAETAADTGGAPAGSSGSAAAASAGSALAAVPNAVDVACAFDGITADYLPPLDPVRAASGTAHLTQDRLDVDVRGGTLGATRVDAATLTMDLTVDPPRAAIGADVSVATADVLAVVGRPPIAFVPPLGVPAAEVGGTSRVHADLRLPIAGNVAPKDLDVRATATLDGVTVPPLVAGVGLHGLDVRVDGTTVDIQGTTGLTSGTSSCRSI